MKIFNRVIRLAGIIILMVACSTFSVLPYMWYSTYSIEDYYYNGCDPLLDLSTAHDDADGFSRAINSAGLPCEVQYIHNVRDAACTANRWTGTNAEINEVDFVFYAGHGCGTGPYLGCTPQYTLTNWSDIRFGASGYLKWVQAAACSWFAADSVDDCPTGMTEFQRWGNCFKGVHTVQGHRALTFEHRFSDSMSTEFWTRWAFQNNTIHNAWKCAQIHWVYEKTGYWGLQPATAGADYSYATELFVNAPDYPAPAQMGCLMWATVGNPLY